MVFHSAHPWKQRLNLQCFLLDWPQSCICTAAALTQHLKAQDFTAFSHDLSATNLAAESVQKQHTFQRCIFWFFNRNKNKRETKIERIDNANLSQSKNIQTEHPKHGEYPKMPPSNPATGFSGYTLLQEEFFINLLQHQNHISLLLHLKCHILSKSFGSSGKGKTTMCWLKALGFEMAHQPSWQITLLSAFSADLSWCRPNSGTTSVLLVSEHDLTFVHF